MISHEKGSLGEDRAAEYLIRSGYNIVKRNFRKAVGEVDIIAVKDNVIIFFEVKNWDYGEWEDLHHSINSNKIHKMRSLADLYLYENPQYKDFTVRFDLVLLSRRMKGPDHIKDFIY